jgi:polar amino acid transport system substrate-binding protein
MVAALAKQLDVRVAWQIVDVAGRITSLQTGKVDIVAGDFTITPARAKVIGFSIPYILDPTQFLVKTSEGTLRTVANLNTPSVTYCTSAGGTAVTWVPQVLPRAKQLSLPTIPDCLEAINAGHAQVLTQEVFYNEQLIKAEPGKYRVIPNPSHPNMSLDFYKPTDIGLGLPHGDKVWASYVDSFLKKYEASSQITTSFKKWFGYPMPSTVRPTS